MKDENGALEKIKIYLEQVEQCRGTKELRCGTGMEQVGFRRRDRKKRKDARTPSRQEMRANARFKLLFIFLPPSFCLNLSR